MKIRLTHLALTAGLFTSGLGAQENNSPPPVDPNIQPGTQPPGPELAPSNPPAEAERQGPPREGKARREGGKRRVEGRGERRQGGPQGGPPQGGPPQGGPPQGGPPQGGNGAKFPKSSFRPNPGSIGPDGPPNFPAGERSPGSQPNGGRGQRPMLPLLAVLDPNHDGVIDAEEISRASEALKKLDHNQDGKITPEEWRPMIPRGQGPPGERQAPGGDGRRPGGPPDPNGGRPGGPPNGGQEFRPQSPPPPPGQ